MCKNGVAYDGIENDVILQKKIEKSKITLQSKY